MELRNFVSGSPIFHLWTQPAQPGGTCQKSPTPMNRAGMADGGEKSQKPAQASPVWEAAMAGAVPTHLWGRPHPGDGEGWCRMESHLPMSAHTNP